MENKILNYIAEHPYCRQREIARACHIWLCSQLFLDSLYNLYKNKLIDCEYFSDPANIEYYNKWYLTEAGKCAIINT